MILSGPSGCGKTSWILNLLSKPEFFDIPPQRIVWCSRTTTDDIKIHLQQRYSCKFFDTLPSLSEVRENDFWVIDDLAGPLKDSQELTDFFTMGAHHKHCMMAYLTQDLFSKGKENTTRTKNAHMIVIFKDPRNARGVEILGQQFFPRSPKVMSDVFKDATKSKPYSHVVLDFLQETPEAERICSNIFTEDEWNDPVLWYDCSS